MGTGAGCPGLSCPVGVALFAAYSDDSPLCDLLVYHCTGVWRTVFLFVAIVRIALALRLPSPLVTLDLLDQLVIFRSMAKSSTTAFSRHVPGTVKLVATIMNPQNACIPSSVLLSTRRSLYGCGSPQVLSKSWNGIKFGALCTRYTHQLGSVAYCCDSSCLPSLRVCSESISRPRNVQ
ncbi:hypothetical protein BKA58DRAFT_9026 [Alternaria rosae]|uniref:uncharacterized protein n=1 Tax=Alternaria rosae TaxID=1187941 RepID=UPI001E8CDAB1|nr:uncharacterized protein BKA58DRAFT_9026 [Alternaria rosae]KAH6881837.1 hypothetical protein BKA58DRAFT_9026 [Alternaria rosae]